MGMTELLINMSEEQKVALVVGAGVAFLGLGLGYKYLWKPEKLVSVGVVSKLLIHPLKSAKAVSVGVAECQKFGLKSGELRDRHWLVVTEDGHMVTGRQQPRLVLVSLTSDGTHAVLNGPNMEELRFPIKQPENKVMDCRVFGEDIQGRDCGDKVSRWLTDYLGDEKTYHVVHFEPQMRARYPAKSMPLFPKKEEVAYPDVAAVMLLSEASVEDLSRESDNKLTVERFRPNIVISDCGPFDEDSWEEIQIGSVRLRRVISCGRCVFTTVDPETGVITRKEPLETLKRYRQCKPSEKHLYQSSPLFGQLLSVKKTGIVQVGDVVYKVTR
ncbi:mitochondrial amidoxime-reducing component 1-like [Neosynchiropus ocellatus]